MTVEHHMETPKSFGSRFGVLNISLSIVTLCYTSMGLFGYLKYGDHVKTNIILSIPNSNK